MPVARTDYGRSTAAPGLAFACTRGLNLLLLVTGVLGCTSSPDPADAFLVEDALLLADDASVVADDAVTVIDDASATVIVDAATRAPDSYVSLDASLSVDAGRDARAIDASVAPLPDAPDAFVPPDAWRRDGGPLVPCGRIGVEGECTSATAYHFCSVASGASEPTLAEVACAGDDRCSLVDGYARCVLAGGCREGTVRCAGASTAEVCSGGAWVTAPCPRDCISTVVGSGCRVDIETAPFRGRLLYEARRPNASLTDWGALETFLANGVIVMSLRGSDLIDAVVTDGADPATGASFEVRVPSALAAGDRLAFLLAGAGADGALSYVVADPGFSASALATDVREIPPDPRVWSWSLDLTTATSGSDITITESLGSGAVRVFDFARYAFALAEAFPPTSRRTLVVWVGMDTVWSCGACAGPWRTRHFDLDFAQQIFISGGADRGYYSDAVTAHELGHYVMAAHGRAVGEAGTHYLGMPVHQGMAWSEGWATAFGADVRGDSRYFDKQGGGFFWFDIGERRYSGSTPWMRPSAAAPLTQLIDENEVAAMLHSLFASAGRGAMWSSLIQPRLTAPPFERGYTARTWSDPMHPEVFTDTGYPASTFPDFLDSALCAGFVTRTQVDAVTVPATYYPYPSGAPLCR